MPGSTRREHAGTSVRAPVTSTTQTRHALTGVRLSRKHSVGMSIEAARQASRIVVPAATRDRAPIDRELDARNGRDRRRARGPRRAGRGRREDAGDLVAHGWPSARSPSVTRPAPNADSMADDAVWPQAADARIAHRPAEVREKSELIGLVAVELATPGAP